MFVLKLQTGSLLRHVQQVYYRADTTWLLLLQATKLPGVLRP